jgi:anti-anti-sigma factor
MTTAPALEDAVRRTLAERPARLVIDLTGAEFFSSAGIAVLVLAHGNGVGVALRVVASDRVVLRPLELTGLIGDLAIYSSLESALDQ